MEKVAQGLNELAEAFLLAKRVSGCSDSTLAIYRLWLDRFFHEVGQPDIVVAHQFVARWQEKGLKSSTLQRGVRALRVFFGWCVSTGALSDNPMRGIAIRLPKTLPTVPSEEELRAVLYCCGEGFIGRRNRALILILADAGLRASEVLRLLVEDWTAAQRSLFVRGGKGRKDRVAFVTPTTARSLREYVETRRILAPEDFLFVDAHNRPLKRRHLIQILHRLSQRAGLRAHRRLHPHALRHYAATSWLRNGMGLEEVRRLLGHESLNTTLRYSSLVASDLQQAHKKAAAIERMRLDLTTRKGE